MVVSCVVVGCTSRCIDSSLCFHRIPKEEKRRQLWLNAIKRKGWTPTSNDRVCGRHFISGKASTDASSPDYVPSVHMGYTASHKLTPEGKKARFARVKKRGCQKEEDVRDAEQKAEAASILLDLSMSQLSGADMECEGDEDASCPDTDIHDGCISQVAKLRKENKQTVTELGRLQRENETLANQCERQFGEEFLRGNQQDNFIYRTTILCCVCMAT
ncbi:hypothetical protein NP493_14g07072 [Ridgeia piscesae]|uniref:THAP-type domain-containing protein n=1 Tax=Ridgeia piscesae TaxID=27915 RepID=A0AAD9PE68_RIDPI|nr:hypothetical protein NP493_14g07072 [Ridgeia piscesae]